MLGCIQNAGPQLTPVEQLPNPDTGKEKPQVYILLDRDTFFWNPPFAAQLETELRIRSTLFVGSSKEELEEKLHEFNARGGSLLLLASDKLEKPAQELGAYTHPSRALTLNAAPQNLNGLSWDLKNLWALVEEYCAQKSLQCEWDKELPEQIKKARLSPLPTLPTNVGGSKLRVGFKGVSFSEAVSSQTPPDRLNIVWDWPFWMQQVLRDLQKPDAASASAPWKKLSLQNGNLSLKLEAHNNPHQKDLNEALNQLRMKYLQ